MSMTAYELTKHTDKVLAMFRQVKLHPPQKPTIQCPHCQGTGRIRKDRVIKI